MAEEMEGRKGVKEQDSTGRGLALSRLLPPLSLRTVRERSPNEKVAQHWSDSRVWAPAPGHPAEQD